MTQPDPTINPGDYQWAIGYEFTQDPLGLDPDWQFISQGLPSREDAIEQYRATIDGLAASGQTLEDMPNMRNFGVYFTEPQQWQRYEVPPAEPQPENTDTPTG
ncbi:hypothetical protein PBI_THONKO_31 [Mycobacterium phage Thonko]|uniref:Uncharacterized protein n=1 Tax=Mycobacterium phage Thonko TaxID=2282910 RepID=A0A346FC78_9CAUD|nr:hypothetical protein I5G57_gp031 [Mycobacterium phage Thonko]AXN53303.1 hypothetical protein PBI_THONKO_31 [Mycobacterium phage Thonko]